MIDAIEQWVIRGATVAGLLVLMVVIMGFRRSARRPGGRSLGWAARLLRWPVMLALLLLFIAVGTLLWRPLPLRLTPSLRLLALAAGSLLYFPGIALYLWGFRSLGRHFAASSGFGVQLHADHQLVEEGPYAFVRHPMYLAVIATALGALLIFRTWAMLIFAPSSLGIILRARREDEILSLEFGEGWEAYRSRVPGWIPRLPR